VKETLALANMVVVLVGTMAAAKLKGMDKVPAA
jgi:hypothetical protein